VKPICFIAARGGSRGVPKKNLRIIAGKPLIAHSIEKAVKSKIFSHVIVSTEDPKIAKVSKKYGADVPFHRPRKLASDTATTEDVLLHGIKKLYSLGYQFDIVVLLDCTVPFLRIQDIAKTVRILRKKKCEVVCAVYKQHLNPYFNIVEVGPKGYLKLVKSQGKRPGSRQEAPTVFQLNGLYTYDAKKFLKKGKALLSKMVPCEIPMESGLMIDTEYEFLIAKLCFKYLYKK